MHTVYLRFEMILERLENKKEDKYSFLFSNECYVSLNSKSNLDIEFKTKVTKLLESPECYKAYSIYQIKDMIDLLLEALPVYFPTILHHTVPKEHRGNNGRDNITKNKKDKKYFLQYVQEQKFKHAASLVIMKKDEPLLRPDFNKRKNKIEAKMFNVQNAKNIIEIEHNGAGFAYDHFKKIVQNEVEAALPKLETTCTEYLTLYLTDEMYLRCKKNDYYIGDDAVSEFEWTEEMNRIVLDLMKCKNDKVKLEDYWLSYIPLAY